MRGDTPTEREFNAAKDRRSQPVPDIDRWLIALTWMVAGVIVLMLLIGGLLLRIAITIDAL